MSDQGIQTGDHKTHLGIKYCYFDDELYCPVCGLELYCHNAYDNRQPKRESCPHLLYFWEETHLGGHFFFVRPDFGKKFIVTLLKSEYYEKYLQNPHRNRPHRNRGSFHHPRPLKNNDIGLFASGAFSSEDPLYIGSKVLRDDPFLLEKQRFEEIGARVGNISFECPSIRHPELLSDLVVVYYNFEGVGNHQKKDDSRTRYIAICPSEYHNPGLRGLSE